MKNLILFFALLISTNVSLAKPITLDPAKDTTSVFTMYGDVGMGIASGLDVNLTIGDLNLKATTESDIAPFSKIILPSALVDKLITKAEVKKWVVGGKFYQCTADNLPLIVMQGNDFNSSTQIHFNCKQVGPQ